MRRIHRFYWFSLLGLSGLWLLINAPGLSTLQGFFPWRNLLIQYSGVLRMNGEMTTTNRLHGMIVIRSHRKYRTERG